MTSELDKATAARLLREHGLATAPYQEISLRDVHLLADSYPPTARLVVRTSREGTADRHLPRLVDATPQSIIDWSNGLPPGSVLLVSSYGHLVASAEVVVTPSRVLVETVYGVWELDNRQRPASAAGSRDGGGITWDRSALGITGARRRFSFDAGIDPEGPMPSWILGAFRDWTMCHIRSLDQFAAAVGAPQIVKVIFYAEWGMQAINARQAGDLLNAADDQAGGPPPGTPVVSSTEDEISSTSAVVLTVSVAREDAACLERLIERMVDAGVTHAYLESGLLSHTAIALREAGIHVRRR